MLLIDEDIIYKQINIDSIYKIIRYVIQLDNVS